MLRRKADKKIPAYSIDNIELGDNDMVIISVGYKLRDQIRQELEKGSLPRQRVLMRILMERCANWEDACIHESSPSDSTFKVFQQNYNKYTYSYWDEKKAFSEINRVLKKGGIHIFTVPLYPFHKTQTRIKIKQQKGEVKIKTILPPIYHGDPFRGLW